ncbi:Uncharacterised protein [Vibrio cholerae]|nr:Uncharacterised protein [Vibrio cholerae]
MQFAATTNSVWAIATMNVTKVQRWSRNFKSRMVIFFN